MKEQQCNGELGYPSLGSSDAMMSIPMFSLLLIDAVDGDWLAVRAVHG